MSLGRNVFYSINALLLTGISVFQIAAPTLVCDLLFTSKCDANTLAIVRTSAVSTGFWAIYCMVVVNYSFSTYLLPLLAIASGILYIYTSEFKMEARIVICSVAGLLSLGHAFYDVYYTSSIPSPFAKRVNIQVQEVQVTKKRTSRQDIANAA